MNRYLNKWHNARNTSYGPVYYENEAKVYLQHNGYTVYKLHDKAFDIVFDGVCVSQRCGVSIELLDRIDSGCDTYTQSPRKAAAA